MRKLVLIAGLICCGALALAAISISITPSTQTFAERWLPVTSQCNDLDGRGTWCAPEVASAATLLASGQMAAALQARAKELAEQPTDGRAKSEN